MKFLRDNQAARRVRMGKQFVINRVGNNFYKWEVYYIRRIWKKEFLKFKSFIMRYKFYNFISKKQVIF